MPPRRSRRRRHPQSPASRLRASSTTAASISSRVRRRLFVFSMANTSDNCVFSNSGARRSRTASSISSTTSYVPAGQSPTLTHDLGQDDGTLRRNHRRESLAASHFPAPRQNGSKIAPFQINGSRTLCEWPHPVAFRPRAPLASLPRNSAINTGPIENSFARALADNARR